MPNYRAPIDGNAARTTAGFARAYGMDQTSRKANCRVGPT
jgi:hypothetical protein